MGSQQLWPGTELRSTRRIHPVSNCIHQGLRRRLSTSLIGVELGSFRALRATFRVLLRHQHADPCLLPIPSPFLPPPSVIKVVEGTRAEGHDEPGRRVLWCPLHPGVHRIHLVWYYDSAGFLLLPDLLEGPRVLEMLCCGSMDPGNCTHRVLHTVRVQLLSKKLRGHRVFQPHQLGYRGYAPCRSARCGHGASVLRAARVDPAVSDCNNYVAAFITFFMLSIFGFAFMFAAFYWMYPTWMALKMHIPGVVTALSLTPAVIVDVSIILALMYILIRKRHCIPERTKTAVDWILLCLVNTGALTAASRIVFVILMGRIATVPRTHKTLTNSQYTTQKDSLAFLGVQEIPGKLYANSFLGSLNTRSFLRRKAEEHPSLDTTCQVATGLTYYRSVHLGSRSLRFIWHLLGNTGDPSRNGGHPAACPDVLIQSTSTRTTKVDDFV